MNLEDLREIQIEERTRSDLQPLLDSFYADVSKCIQNLRVERENILEGGIDAVDAKTVRRIEDEIRTVGEVVEAIYDRRVGKILKGASLTAAGLGKRDGSLAGVEVELFRNLVELLQKNRIEILERTSSEKGDKSQRKVETNQINEEAPLQENIDQKGEEETSNITIKVVQELGKIYGVDGNTYDLREGKIISLPKENAQPLIKAKVVQITDEIEQ
jgi:DNA replication factor GINS